MERANIFARMVGQSAKANLKEVKNGPLNSFWHR
jgi:hypothetical protein